MVLKMSNLLLMFCYSASTLFAQSRVRPVKASKPNYRAIGIRTMVLSVGSKRRLLTILKINRPKQSQSLTYSQVRSAVERAAKGGRIKVLLQSDLSVLQGYRASALSSSKVDVRGDRDAGRANFVQFELTPIRIRMQAARIQCKCILSHRGNREFGKRMRGKSAEFKSELSFQFTSEIDYETVVVIQLAGDSRRLLIGQSKDARITNACFLVVFIKGLRRTMPNQSPSHAPAIRSTQIDRE